MGCGHSKLSAHPRRKKYSDNENEHTNNSAEEDSETDENGASIASSIDVPTPVDDLTSSSESEDELEEPEPAPQQPSIDTGILPIEEHQVKYVVSENQVHFFEMLEKKIEQGKEYDSNSETEIEMEKERKRKLIESWNAVTQSSSTNIPAPVQRLTRSIARISERQCSGGPRGVRRVTFGELPERPRAAPTPDASPSTSFMGRTHNRRVHRKYKARKERQAALATEQIRNSSCSTSTAPEPVIAEPELCSLPQTESKSSTKVIAPPEDYQDRKNTVNKPATTQPTTNSGRGTLTVQSVLAQQRQQTALHLQQCMAMKQAREQSFLANMKRSPRTVFSKEYFEAHMSEGELAAQYGHPALRATNSAPAHQSAQELTLTGEWPEGAIPPGVWYYQDFVPLSRENRARSAGTLTCYQKSTTVQHINVVRGKPVGEIVTVDGQQLAVSDTSAASAGAASSNATAGSSSATAGSSSASAGSSSATAGSSSATAGSSSVTAGSSSATAGSSSVTAGSSSATAGSSSVTAGSSSATAGSSSATAGSSSATAGSSSATAGSSSATADIAAGTSGLDCKQNKSKTGKRTVKCSKLFNV